MKLQSAFLASTAKHNLLREVLKSQLTSSAPSTNHCCLFREGLETQPACTVSISLIIDSDISDVINSSIKPSRTTGYSLWRRHCRCLGIKDSIPATCSLCKYTWKVVGCIVLTGKGHPGPNIWSETLEQAESTEDIMKSIWGKEAHRQCKASETKSCLLSPSGK